MLVVFVLVGREEPLPTVVKKLFGCEEEPEDATSDDGHLSSDDVRYEKQLSNSSSFTLTASSSNDSLPSDEEDAGKPDTDESSNQETDVDSHCNAPDWESSLRDENERLRSEVADLSSALVARDMEIASLRERCQFLMNAVEQQDEVIAKIYAAASNPPSATSPIPIPQATTVVDSQKQRVLTKKSSKKKVLESVRRYPGNVGRVEPAREMLEAHLDSIGYRQQDAGEGLAYLSEGIAAEREKNAGSEVEILNVALDRLLFASPPKSEPLFIDTPKEDPRSVASSPGPTVHRRPPQSPFLERRGSSTSEEDFAKSAGFLRKANRKLSGRLSVSDFGLLGDETQLSDAGQSIRCNQSDEFNGDKDGASERGQSRSASQRNLFAEIDVANREDAKRKKAQQQQSPSGADNEKEEEEELTYAEFLERLSLPASRDILDSIRMFVGSILGPRGDGKPPRHSDYLDYDFYGHHEFRRRYDYFFQKMDERLSSHPAWRHASEAMLSKARDGIEKYVMEKLSDIALHQLPECQQWKKEDDRLFRRMKLLSVRMHALLRCSLFGSVR